MRRDEEIARALAAYEAAVRDERPVADVAATVVNAVKIKTDGTLAAPQLLPTALARPPRPQVRQGLQIDAYDPRVLVAMAKWIRSDGLLRTDDELTEALFAELGLRRHGTKIDEALQAAVRGAAP